MRTRQQLIRYVLLLFAVVVLLMLLAQQFNFRLDLTSDARYTLSDATLELLEEMQEPATVTAYFTEELPPDLARTRIELQDLLIEYAARSNGNVVYEFIDPNQSEEKETEAQQAGIRPLIVSVREKDKSEQMRAYMGAVLRMGDQMDIIPLVQPGSSLEYSLSSSIKKISVVDKPVLGFLQGHGEPSINAMVEALQGLNVLFSVQPLALFDTIPVHERFDAIMIVNPTDSFSDAHLAQLERFVEQGKGLFVALSRVQANLAENQFGYAQGTRLETWLKKIGLTVKPEFIVDASCGQVQVRQQRGMFNFASNMPFYYFPLFSKFPEHPITSGLEGVVLQFASPMEFSGDSTISYTPILTTSDKSNALPAPQYMDLQKQWTEADFPLKGLVAAAALEGALFDGAAPARMVVVSNGRFAVNGEGQQMQQLNPDNVNLLVNATEWITDNTGLIELRTRGTNYRPLEEIEEGSRTSIKWLNLLLPILLVVAYGLIRSSWRRKQRKQRMQAEHVE